MSDGPDESRWSPATLLPLVVVALVTGWCWAPILHLPFTGEDFVILERLGRGGPAWDHVFRPLSGSWLGLLHRVFGADSPLPYHAGSLVLHLVNTTLVFLIGRELFSSRWSAGAVAALFGISAGAIDSLVWIAAVNRLWAGFGALLAYLGLLRLPEGKGLALAMVVVGFLVAALSNEEVYGLTPVVLGWLAWTAWRMPHLRRPLGICAVLLAVEISLQFVFLQQVPGGSSGLTARGVEGALGTITARAEQMAYGLGLDPGLGIWIPAVCLVLLLVARQRRVALFALATWLGSMIPFALSTASNYRAYPTLAPTAWLIAGGVYAALELFQRGRTRDLKLPVFLVLVCALLWESAENRHDGLLRWRRALDEVEICARDARRLALEHDRPPVLVNLELSSAGPFYYRFGIGDPHGIDMRGFLDAASAYEDFGELPQGWWYGRRLDGTYGVIEPERYLQRPIVEPLRVYGRTHTVQDLAEARAALGDPELDILQVAVVEDPRGEVSLGASGENVASGSIQPLSPFEHEQRSARMSIRVETDGRALVAYQEHWLYEFLYRTSPDQAVITNLVEVRRVRMRARDRATGTELATYPVNGFGFGFLVDAGVHDIDLDWSIRPAVKRP